MIVLSLKDIVSDNEVLETIFLFGNDDAVSFVLHVE